ncbi:MAG: lysylphosphatidylglycerol synthase domain-containing protein [Rhodospirillaceae bacterium]
MKLGVIAVALCGLAAIIALIAGNDATAVFGAVAGVGWGLVAVVLVRATIVSTCGFGWARLIRPLVPCRLRTFLFIRWIREAVNVLLPVAAVGGDLVGGRVLTFWGVTGGLAAAGILVDLLLQACAQVLFTLTGLGLLLAGGRGGDFAGWVIVGLLVAAVALGSFYGAQRFGLFDLFERLMLKAAARWPQASFGGELRLHDNIQAIYANRGAVLSSFLLHIVAWFIGAAEIWIALYCMGTHPTIVEALVLESLGQAVRGAAFPVPGALGVQESGFLLLGQLYGITPEVAIALSLVKRVPDLVLGVPGLAAWQFLEARRLLERRKTSISAVADPLNLPTE